MPPKRKLPAQSNKISNYFQCSVNRTSNDNVRPKASTSTSRASQQSVTNTTSPPFAPAVLKNPVTNTTLTPIAPSVLKGDNGSHDADTLQAESHRPLTMSADNGAGRLPSHQHTYNSQLFLADEEEDDHVERLNRIIIEANSLISVHGRPLIPLQQPTYEPMLMVPPRSKDKPAIPVPEITPHADELDNIEKLDEDFVDPGDSEDEDETTVSAIKPFLFSETRICPFVEMGLCQHKGFTTQRGLSAHCKQKHLDQNGKPIILTTVEEDPLEDGTAKIPCRWKCNKMFSSYHAANDHAKKAKAYCDESEANVYPRPCPWASVPGTACAVPPLTSARAESRHCTEMHRHDVRGPYQCHLCGDYYADLYALRSHVDGCATQANTRKFARHRFQVGGDLSSPACFLVIARVSCSLAPTSWYQGHEFSDDGITGFAADILKDFVFDFACEEITTIFHAYANVKTRMVPTERLNAAFRETHPYHRRNLNIAWKYTHAIKNDVVSIAKAVKPTLMSVGLDGFACKTDRIVAFMKRNRPFTYIIRETELVYSMSEQYFPQHKSGLYYGTFESADILRSVESGTPTSPGIANLLEAWDAVQGWKDDNARRRTGRNGNHRRVFKYAPQPIYGPQEPVGMSTGGFEG